MKLEPGRELLHFRLVEQIGEGGMGVVWKAFDTTLDREVAIKILPNVFSDDPEQGPSWSIQRAFSTMASASSFR